MLNNKKRETDIYIHIYLCTYIYVYIHVYVSSLCVFTLIRLFTYNMLVEAELIQELNVKDYELHFCESLALLG